MVSSSFWQLAGVQVFKGIGLTANSTAAGTVVAELAPRRRRGEALGVFGIIAPIAQAFGPALGMILLNRAGFSFLFAVSALMGLLACASAFRIKMPPKERPAHVTMKLINRDALLPSGVMAFVYVAMAPVYSFIPLYFTSSGIGDPGLFFTVYALSMMLIRVITGKLSDILGRAAIFVPGALAMALASFYLAASPDYWGTMAAAAALGAGFGAAQPALMALAIDRANATERGSATSTVYTFVDLGYSFATLADGYILQQFGFGAMFGANATVTALGVILYFLVRNHTKRARLAPRTS
jgi:MFS family permease